LKELENYSATLEKQIQTKKEEKAEILGEIMQAER
jgi:hypothetical protein